MCLYLYLAGYLSRFSCELGVSLNVKKTASFLHHHSFLTPAVSHPVFYILPTS